MIVILGNGGHAGVLADILERKNWPYRAVDSREADVREGELFVVGLGDMKLRRDLYEHWRPMRDTAHVVHRTATIADDARIGDAPQMMAGVIIQPGCKIGNNVLINTRASVDHDCIIGDHVHIAPGAILCGGVTVGEGAFIGAGAIIPEGRVVPAGAFVKAGSVFA